MLTYIQDAGDIDYCIVHKLDRLARNRADDVDINRALDQAGVRLISTTENIDQTPRRRPPARHHELHRRVLQPQPGQRSG